MLTAAIAEFWPAALPRRVWLAPRVARKTGQGAAQLSGRYRVVLTPIAAANPQFTGHYAGERGGFATVPGPARICAQPGGAAVTGLLGWA
jgi:hypothetical protein